MAVRADEDRLKRYIADRLGIPYSLIKGERWEEELIKKKLVSEEKLLSLLSEFFGVPSSQKE